ncbi:MAG: penicillin-binding protein 2, partial [Deltaproteobacteria bacterium]|nr:penicillin-binding protein 2 [Deltaproteobacteria bacterium]
TNFGPRKVRRTITAKTVREIKKMMQAVVADEGTGKKAVPEGYSVCGKTGTAQKVDPKGGYARGRYTSSFVGFAPVQTPRIAVLVVVDEPKKAHYGGTVAAPAFRRIVQETLGYLKVPPDVEPKGMTARVHFEEAG